MTINIKEKYTKVVLFGKPNVGKSTLFNCLTEKHHALISDIPGTTRDANIATVDWQDKKFELIDTGGILDDKLIAFSKKQIKALNKKEIKSDDDINFLVQKQSRDLILEADIILFMVDAKNGLLPQDKYLSLTLKDLLGRKKTTRNKKIFLVANKCDSPSIRNQIAEFNKLGLGNPYPISATTGSGTGDLLDVIVKNIETKSKNEVETVEKEEKDRTINVCMLGKPNVGKSSLVNSIFGEAKIIVSPVPHTTREPKDTKIEYKNHIINFIDTAGISKTGRKSIKKRGARNRLENLSIEKSLKVLRRAQIALLVIDINAGLTHQEAKLVEEVVNSKTSLILIANKWDLIEEKNRKTYTWEIYSHLPFAQWATIHFTSALTGSKVDKIVDLIIEIDKARKTEIPEGSLDRFLKNAIRHHTPIKAKGTKRPYIYKLKQETANPLVFSVKIGPKDTISTGYLKYLENRLRDKFKLIGTPITVYVEKDKKIHGQADLERPPSKKKPKGDRYRKIAH